jgi:3-hydroxyacyl-[acyl-carrier-protein] dehydratase
MTTWDMPTEIADLFRFAVNEPLIPLAKQRLGPYLNRQAVEATLPHRDPFLLIDQVTMFNLEEGLIAASYDLSRAQAVFAGHFPQRPIWPGVLQVEAIAQAGILLYKQGTADFSVEATMTHILGARFIQPITPGGEVEILARVFEEGLLVTIVGQCRYKSHTCSVAVVNVLA